MWQKVENIILVFVRLTNATNKSLPTCDTNYQYTGTGRTSEGKKAFIKVFTKNLLITAKITTDNATFKNVFLNI